jgi:hypothetical protein
VEHPFLPSLTDKSFEELQTITTDLMGKLNFAYRMGNRPMINQLLMVLEGYKNETGRRMDAMMKKQEGQTKISVEKK